LGRVKRVEYDQVYDEKAKVLSKQGF